MARTLSGLEVDYVCNPTSLRLKAKEDLPNRRIHVAFTIGEKTAHEWLFKASLAHYGDRDQLDKLVGMLIRQLMKRSKRSVQNHLDFLALNIWSGLKEVRTKSGKLIWHR